MRQERATLRQFKELRGSVRNVPSFNIGGGNWEIDFSIRGPELSALARYTEALRDKAEELGGIVDACPGIPVMLDTEARRLTPEEKANRKHP